MKVYWTDTAQRHLDAMGRYVDEKTQSVLAAPYCIGDVV